MINGGETDLRVVSAHNVLEHVTRTKEDVTGMLVYGGIYWSSLVERGLERTDYGLLDGLTCVSRVLMVLQPE